MDFQTRMLASNYLSLITRQWENDPYIDIDHSEDVVPLAISTDFSMIPMIEYYSSTYPSQGYYPLLQWVELKDAHANINVFRMPDDGRRDVLSFPVPFPMHVPVLEWAKQNDALPIALEVHQRKTYDSGHTESKLYYLDSDGNMMSVSLFDGSDLAAPKPFCR